MIAPIDLNAVWEAHKAAVLAPRDDGTVLHSSDLHSCAYALHNRLTGVPSLPFDDGTFANFERGHAVEGRIEPTLLAYAYDHGFTLSRGEEVSHEGIVGNLDFVLYDVLKPVAIIDLSTTAKKTPDWQYGHALKSAFYAVAKGCDVFCEWVICFGFGGTITAQQAHWFSLDDEATPGRTWRQAVAEAIIEKKMIAGMLEPPYAQPPTNPLDGQPEAWRCGKAGSGKSYCQAQCPRNAAYTEAPLEIL
jgi:hypothetical protein